MQKFKLVCTTIEEAKWLNEVSYRQNFNIDVVSSRHKVDAKSILGIFSLDLSKGVTLEVGCDVKAYVDEYIEELREKCNVVEVE